MGLSIPFCGNFNRKNHLKLWYSESEPGVDIVENLVGTQYPAVLKKFSPGLNIKIATIRNQLRIGLPKIHDDLGTFNRKINILFVYWLRHEAIHCSIQTNSWKQIYLFAV